MLHKVGWREKERPAANHTARIVLLVPDSVGQEFFPNVRENGNRTVCPEISVHGASRGSILPRFLCGRQACPPVRPRFLPDP